MSISVETLALSKKYTDEHGGGGGTTNYNQLTNKPKINGVTVEGEKSFEDYGFPDLTESVEAAEAAKQGAETAKGQAETFATQAQQSATQSSESATAAQGHASTAQIAATAAQESAEAAAASAEEAKGVIPPTDTAKAGDVPTFDGEAVVWKAPSGAYPFIQSSESTVQLFPNTFYQWGEMAAITITFGSETEGVTNEYCGQFTSGDTPTTFSAPDSVKWSGGLTVPANAVCQFSILNNVGVMISA